MALSPAERLINLGVPVEQATEFVTVAGESGLQIGTTSTTAMAGNRTPTSTIRGGVLQRPAIADIEIAPTAADYNAVLAALRAAGVLAT